MSFEFGIPLGYAAGLLAIGAALAFAFWWARTATLPRPRRAALALLRAAGLMLLLFLTLDPMIVRFSSRPGEDYVAVLFDDSQSMGIVGAKGGSRGEHLRAAYESARENFEGKLRQAHQLAFFRFGSSIGRVGGVKELAFDQNESDPVGAAAAAVRDLSGAAVSAIVIFSDGVAQGPTALKNPESAADPAIPLYTVGVDTEAPWRDLEMKSIAVTRTNFDKCPVSLTAEVGAEGLRGRRAVVEALEGERVAATKTIEITSDTLNARVLLEFVPQVAGWTACQTRIRLADAKPGERDLERVPENNSRAFVVDNRPRDRRILYLCGRPNWENKFVRRALEGDAQLKLSSLVRVSGPNRKFVFLGGGKTINNRLFDGFDESEVAAPRWDEAVFVRIGLGPSELATGYPSQPKDLFPYDLVIWGDIEADYFSSRQMELTRDFVAKRGGSFLMLGGPRAFTEGHYAGTLAEGMMPVALRSVAANAPAADGRNQLFHARPTADGLISGIWALDRDPARNDAAWGGLPDLFGVNHFAMLRAGATELARISATAAEIDGQPLFAWQPYGLGHCAVLATGETWQWKMENVPGDQTHERFWRQMVRALASQAPAPIVLKSGGDGLTVGRPSRLEFLVRDGLFDKREGLNTSIQVERPGQKPMDLPAEESIADAGVYSCEFAPEATGMHLVNLTAMNDKKEVVGSLQEAVCVEPDIREYQHAAYNPQFLKSLAGRTHGGFYNLDNFAELAGSIPRTSIDRSTREVSHLWRNPAFYAALALLFSLEWYLRRKWGHA